MIITRSPLRISLGGGGTDLPSYYREHGGFVLSAAIDKYVYINIHPRFVDGFLLKYSQLEEVATIDAIKHPIIREALRLTGVRATNLEIASMADITALCAVDFAGWVDIRIPPGNARSLDAVLRPGRVVANRYALGAVARGTGVLVGGEQLDGGESLFITSRKPSSRSSVLLEPTA